MSKEGGQEGLCQVTPPLPQQGLHLTGLGSPSWEVMATAQPKPFVCGKSRTEQDHTQQEKEISVVWVPPAITL